MSRRKLLLADDSVTIQKVVNLTFADEGVDVETVGDGDTAMERLSGSRPDIVLADVNMPGLSGYQICERLRADEATRDIPVILLVGSFEPFDEGEASRVGANAYLTKPFQSIRQLITQVNELIDASKPVESGETPAVGAPQIHEDRESSSEFETPETREEAQTPEPRYFDDLGYEAPAVVTPQPEPEPDDIDSLYTQSIEPSATQAELSDVGFDDEMIETSYSADDANSDLAEFKPHEESGFAKPLEAVYSNEERAEEITLSEPAVSHEEGGLGHHQQEFQAEEGIVGETATSEPATTPQGVEEGQSGFEKTIEYTNWQPADMRENFASESPASHPEVETRTDAPPADATEVSPGVGDDTIRMDNRFETAGSGTFQFDELDLLDLEAAKSAKIEITTPLNAIEQGSNKQLVSLSPELIEMIAQRVVEKMSEKY